MSSNLYSIYLDIYQTVSCHLSIHLVGISHFNSQWGDSLSSSPLAMMIPPCHASVKSPSAEGRLVGEVLHVSTRHDFATWEQFVGLLNEPGPWIAAIDFPFGLPARLVEESRWRDSWLGYVSDCVAMGKQRFVEYMRNYRNPVTGERRLFRETDKLAGSRSPMQVDYTPVGRMFFVGAQILAEAA